MKKHLFEIINSKVYNPETEKEEHPRIAMTEETFKFFETFCTTVTKPNFKKVGLINGFEFLYLGVIKEKPEEKETKE